MKFIDPLKIDSKDLPCIVLVDDMRGFVSWAIKAHSSGNYNHIVTMSQPGYFDTQDFVGFRRVEIKKYMKDNVRLKFWTTVGMSGPEKRVLCNKIDRDLHKSWIKRRYDLLGLVGQLLKIRQLNNTWTRYCSERVRDYFTSWLKLPIHPTPSEIDAICRNTPKMELLGAWEADYVD